MAIRDVVATREAIETVEVVETPPEILGLWERYAPWYRKTFGKVGVFRGFAKELKKYLLPAPGGTVLDAGCGPGLHFQAFIKAIRPSRLIGLDISPGMLNEARKTTSNWRIRRLCRRRGCRIALKEADLCQGIPFPDNTFDAQVYHLVLYYLPAGEWKNVLREAFRVARPGGYLVTTNALKRFDFRKELGKWPLLKEMFLHLKAIVLFVVKVKPVLIRFQDLEAEGVIGYPTREEMVGFLHELGFKEVEIQYVWRDNMLMIRAHKPE